MLNKSSSSDVTADENVTIARIRAELNQAENLDAERNLLFPPRQKQYDTRWKQQKNIAIRQQLSFVHILILYGTIGIAYIAIGIFNLFLTRGVPKPIQLDYTDCLDEGTRQSCPNLFSRSDNEESTKNVPCTCNLQFDVPDDSMKSSTVVLYYELENFYQNVRNYRKDVDWNQLGGKPMEPKCRYEYFNKVGKKYIYPCGKIANSYFTDTFSITFNDNEVNLIEDKIAWESDKHRFKNPFQVTGDLKEYMEKFEYELPRSWPQEIKDNFLAESKAGGRGVENQHFIVWMRTAAFRKFRKKYAVIKGLEKGTYEIKITYRYEVKSFSGKKKIVIRVDNEDKPIDSFFFHAYTGVGAVCVSLGPVFIIFKLIFKSAVQRRYRKWLTERAKQAATETIPPPDQSTRSSQVVTEAPSTAIVSA